MKIECPKHGPDCSYNLRDHPLPPQGPIVWSKDEDDPDPDGWEADRAAKEAYGV